MKPTGPAFDADLQLDVTTDNEGVKYFMSSWSIDAFDSSEIAAGFIKDVSFTIRKY